MDYEPFAGMPDVEYMYRTGRGSTYAHLPGSQTIRNRSDKNHTDKSVGLQQKSGKTIYVDKPATSALAVWLQNPDAATQLLPEIGADGKPTGRAQVKLLEDYGPRKAGSVVATAPFTTKPAVGLHPVEIFKSESPIGDTGRGIHFGNNITEVLEGGLGQKGNGRGAAMGSTRGSLNRGAGDEIGMLNPLKLAKGGAIKMPDNYSQGNWKLI
jgi:hypothetical protein